MKQKLTLYSDTFLWRKGEEGLLYNARSGRMSRFEATGRVQELCGQLETIDNLYSLPFDPERCDGITRKFIETITSQEFGYVGPLDSSFISLPPLLNIQWSVEHLERDKDREIGENALDYLSTLVIYLGGVCPEKSYFRQVLYPVCSDEKLDTKRISRFLEASWAPTLHTIDLVVSDALSPELIEMGRVFAAYKEQIVFHFLCNDPNHVFAIPAVLANAGYKVRFICETSGSPVEDSTMRKNIAQDQKLSFGYDFIVRSDREYRFWSELAEDLDLKDYSIIPVYDDNPDFFERNVFLSEFDLAQTRLSRREVFAHQAINTNAFGTLTVMPDGKVYSDVDAQPLGTLEDSVYELIVRELRENHAWRRIRSSGLCQKCIYQWLCPSPTAYEKAAGRETVCTFR